MHQLLECGKDLEPLGYNHGVLNGDRRRVYMDNTVRNIKSVKLNISCNSEVKYGFYIKTEERTEEKLRGELRKYCREKSHHPLRREMRIFTLD